MGNDYESYVTEKEIDTKSNEKNPDLIVFKKKYKLKEARDLQILRDFNIEIYLSHKEGKIIQNSIIFNGKYDFFEINCLHISLEHVLNSEIFELTPEECFFVLKSHVEGLIELGFVNVCVKSFELSAENKNYVIFDHFLRNDFLKGLLISAPEAVEEILEIKNENESKIDLGKFVKRNKNNISREYDLINDLWLPPDIRLIGITEIEHERATYKEMEYNGYRKIENKIKLVRGIKESSFSINIFGFDYFHKEENLWRRGRYKNKNILLEICDNVNLGIEELTCPEEYFFGLEQFLQTLTKIGFKNCLQTSWKTSTSILNINHEFRFRLIRALIEIAPNQTFELIFSNFENYKKIIDSGIYKSNLKEFIKEIRLFTWDIFSALIAFPPENDYYLQTKSYIEKKFSDFIIYILENIYLTNNEINSVSELLILDNKKKLSGKRLSSFIEEIISNEFLSQNLISKLFNDSNKIILNMLYFRSYLKESQLEKLFELDHEEFKKRGYPGLIPVNFFKNNIIPPYIIIKYYGYIEKYIEERPSHFQISQKLKEIISKMSLIIHKRKNQTTESLIEQDDDEHVRKIISLRPDIPYNYFKKLANDKDLEIKILIAAHPNLPNILKNQLIKDNNPYIWETLALRTDLSKDQIFNLLESNGEFIKKILFTRGRLPEEVIEKYLKEIRELRSYSPYRKNPPYWDDLTPNLYKKFSDMEDTKELVLDNISYKPNLSKEVFLKLLKCADPKIIKRLLNRQDFPNELLTEFVDHVNIEIRKNLASRDFLPEDILLKLGKDENAEIRAIIASKIYLPSKIIRILAEDTEEKVRINLAKLKELSLEILEILSSDISEKVRKIVAAYQFKLPDNILKKMTVDKSLEVRRIISMRKDFSEELCKSKTIQNFIELNKLFNSYYWRDRYKVSKFKYLPREYLEKLAEDESWWVRANIAKRKDIPNSLILRFCDDKSPNVRRAIANRNKLSEEVILRLASDELISVRKIIARRTVLQPEIIKKFIEDDRFESVGVKTMIINRDDLSLKDFERLCEDESEWIKGKLSERKDLPEYIRKKLRNDTSDWVRMKTRENET